MIYKTYKDEARKLKIRHGKNQNKRERAHKKGLGDSLDEGLQMTLSTSSC